MRFIDEVKVTAKAGHGGDGMVAWRREKFVPRGGPAGGDGGNGGDIVFEVDEGLHSLLDYRFNPLLRAKDGEKGGPKNMHGKNGPTLVSKVPPGTQIFDNQTGELLYDLKAPGESAVICRGGSGGFGNSRFATPSRQSPEFAKPGLAGEDHILRLNLKVMADVGLLGFPNAGKSTLLAHVSAARPKIADYPFTTLVPQLGVVGLSVGKSFVMADIPGLIEGAAEGAGLGHRFLKHLERVRVLCHLIEPSLAWNFEDGSSDDGGTLLDRYEALRRELSRFDPVLDTLPEVVALTKIETVAEDTEVQEDMKIFEQELKARGKQVFWISAVTGEGLDELKYALWGFAEKKKEAKLKQGQTFDPMKT